MLDYAQKVGISRGSYLVYNQEGTLPDNRLDELFRTFVKPTDTSVLQEISYDKKNDTCKTLWRKVRLIPQEYNWFENVWKNFQNSDIFK